MPEKIQSRKDKKSRLNLSLAPKVRERMELLQDATGAQTITEVVSRALALYDFVITQKNSGAKVLIEDKQGTREVVILS